MAPALLPGRGAPVGAAARAIAIAAGASGVLSVLLLAGGLLRLPAIATRQDSTAGVAGLLGLLSNLAPLVAVLSWGLAVAATSTALVARHLDRSDRRARTALRAAAPGAVLGTVMLVLVVAWFATWAPQQSGL